MIRQILVSFFLVMLPLGGSAEEVRAGVLRTPDARFEKLKDFTFAPNYMEIDGLRIHYVDEGPKDGAPILLLHGQPTWGYLFRTMIPVLAQAGHRVIVPDMAGFGRSDKPINNTDYTYQKHVDMISELVARLDLRDVTFFGQDWGGLVGLRVVAATPERFARIVVSNTGLISAEGIRAAIGYPLFKLAVWWQGKMTFDEMIERKNFTSWIAYAYYGTDLDVGRLMQQMGQITDADIIAGYEAPYPSGEYKAGAQVFPYLIPSQLSENAGAWKNVFEKWEKPFLVAFTDEDPVSSGTDMAEQFENRVPGASRIVIKGVGHFVQEEVGPRLASVIDNFIRGNAVEGFSKP